MLAVDEVDQILLHTMQTRGKALVFDSVKIDIRHGLFPGDCVPGESVNGDATSPLLLAANVCNSPHLLVEDHLEKSRDWRRLGLGHWSALLLELMVRVDVCLHEMFHLLSDAVIVTVA